MGLYHNFELTTHFEIATKKFSNQNEKMYSVYDLLHSRVLNKKRSHRIQDSRFKLLEINHYFFSKLTTHFKLSQKSFDTLHKTC